LQRVGVSRGAFIVANALRRSWKPQVWQDGVCSWLPRQGSWTPAARWVRSNWSSSVRRSWRHGKTSGSNPGTFSSYSTTTRWSFTRWKEYQILLDMQVRICSHLTRKPKSDRRQTVLNLAKHVYTVLDQLWAKEEETPAHYDGLRVIRANKEMI
jgi:hypothetical protein